MSTPILKTAESDDYQPIENYGVIGDLRTIALIGINGSIDYMCFPDFDSPTIFAALLDKHKGGSFEITPAETQDVKFKQMYLPDTNILMTRFLFQDGIGEVVDFMPVSEIYKENILVRRVQCIKGEIALKMSCAPRFNYARSPHKTFLNGNEASFVSEDGKGLSIKLKSTVPMRIKEGDAYAEFTIKPGENVEFILENTQITESSETSYCQEFVDDAFRRTIDYWRKWVSKSTYVGRWREMVTRSALVLKLLISNRHGSIVAAPTFGLPELIGGGKNWDYRYTWIRDAAFTVYALMRLGYTHETESFVQWIEKILNKQIKDEIPLRLMYGIDGRTIEGEIELHNLEGYKKSSPVRIGNAAYLQLQLDIYGELMDSIYLYDKFVNPISHDSWAILTYLMDWLCNNWRSKDNGIWEIRGKPREFLHSRFMCWVALDRAVRLATKRSFHIPEKWVQERDKIYQSVFHDFWNEKLDSFVSSKKSHEVDASCLLMPLVRFISPKDPRFLSTLKRIEQDLLVDALVYRYPEEQALKYGLKKGEGTFTLCSFWYTECLSRAGKLIKARYYFEKMLTYANHVGLYSEQLGFQGNHLGNFPQAFTHLALISAAFDLNRRLDEHPDYWKEEF